MDDEKKIEGISRRSLLTTGVSAGIALAVAPAHSWAAATTEDGLEVITSSLAVEGGSLPLYSVKPKGKGPFPVVIVIHEIFGVHAYIQDVCRRLAKKGYLAVAPYLYFRQGDVTVMKDIDEIRDKAVSKVSQAQIMADLDALSLHLQKDKTADVKRMGITGFCWGGTVVWMYAAHNPKLKAGVAWYGRLVGDATTLQPKFPVDIAPSLKVPVLGLYGGKDKGIPLASIEKMREALKKDKSGSEIIVYPEADHGFHADYRPSYHERSAKEGWDACLKWFKDHGV